MASVASEENDLVALNVMPMLDIFSILILFLLMSFSTEPISHDLNRGVELPESMTLSSLDEVPLVMLTTSEVLLNDKVIANINNNRITGPGLTQGAVEPLFTELVKIAETNERFMKDKDKSLGLTLEIDRRHDFRLIKKVMLSAQQAGFVKFKMMVSKRL